MKSQVDDITENQIKPVMLGSLGLMAYFKHKDMQYRTITYAPSNTSPSYGTRWCLNMQTIKAEFLFCRTKVIPVFPVEHSI
jgi:hypothetical protein